MVDELSCCLPGFGETKSVNDIVQSGLQQGKEYLSGYTFFSFCSLEKIAKLLLSQSIHDSEFLLLDQTLSVITYFSTKIRSVLPWRVGSSFKSFVGRKNRHAKASVDSSGGASVTRHNEKFQVMG